MTSVGLPENCNRWNGWKVTKKMKAPQAAASLARVKNVEIRKLKVMVATDELRRSAITTVGSDLS